MSKFKIIETELFKQQKKELPKKARKDLDKVLKSISKNPTKAPNSMNIFGEPSAKELRQWTSDIKVEDIDIILEYLFEKKCLNKKGKKLSHQFWEKYIKEND